MMRDLIDQPPWHKGTVDYHLQRGCEFHYRDIQSTIAYLLQQQTFAEHMVWEAVKEFDDGGNRVYMDMYTGDWWWETQVRV